MPTAQEGESTRAGPFPPLVIGARGSPSEKKNEFLALLCVFLWGFCRFQQSTLSTDPWLSWADPEGGQGVQTPPPPL